MASLITVHHPRTRTIQTITRSSFMDEMVGMFPAMTEAAYESILAIQQHLNAETPAKDSLAVRKAEALGLIITTN